MIADEKRERERWKTAIKAAKRNRLTFERDGVLDIPALVAERSRSRSKLQVTLVMWPAPDLPHGVSRFPVRNAAALEQPDIDAFNPHYCKTFWCIDHAEAYAVATAFVDAEQSKAKTALGTPVQMSLF